MSELFVPNATHTLRADVPDFDTAHCGPALRTFVTSTAVWASLYLLLRWTDACACGRRNHRATGTDAAAPAEDAAVTEDVLRRVDGPKANGHGNGNGNDNGSGSRSGSASERSRSGWSALSTLCEPYASLDAANRSLWNSYVVSTVHSVVALYGGVQTVVLDSERAFHSAMEAAFGHSARRDHYLMVTCGYLFYDLVLCIWSYYHYHYRPTRKAAAQRDGTGSTGSGGSGSAGSTGSSAPAAFDALTVLHHVLIIVAFGGGMYARIGTVYMCAFLWNELSTVFLNANYFMACNGRLKDTPPYRLNGMALVAAFAVFRVLWNAAAVYHLLCVTWPVHWPLVHVKAPAFVLTAMTLTLLAVGHMLLNWLWFGRIIAAAARKLGRGRGRDRARAGRNGDGDGDGNGNGNGCSDNGNGHVSSPQPTATVAADAVTED